VNPEELLLLLEMPPIGKVKRRVIVRIGEGDSVPDLAEEWRLTKFGKILCRSEVILLDGHSNAGRPEELKGACTSCKRYTFGGAPCQECGSFTCSGCGKDFPASGRTRFLCPACLVSAEAALDNWQEYDLRRRKE